MKTGTHSTPHSGFTLIELLIVIVIMGIAMGLVTLQILPDNRTSLQEEANRLALLLENANIEARASGRSLAWSDEKSSYGFWRKNNYGDWVRIDDDALFRTRKLPGGMRISEVTVEEQALKPGEYIQLSATSFAVPFRIRLSNEYGSASVIGKSTGSVAAALDAQPNAVPAQ